MANKMNTYNTGYVEFYFMTLMTVTFFFKNYCSMWRRKRKRMNARMYRSCYGIPRRFMDISKRLFVSTSYLSHIVGYCCTLRQARAGMRHHKFLFWLCCIGNKSLSAEKLKCTLRPFLAWKCLWLKIQCIPQYFVQTFCIPSVLNRPTRQMLNFGPWPKCLPATNP